jgi:hypothetical protein
MPTISLKNNNEETNKKHIKKGRNNGVLNSDNHDNGNPHAREKGRAMSVRKSCVCKLYKKYVLLRVAALERKVLSLDVYDSYGNSDIPISIQNCFLHSNYIGENMP